MKLKSVANSYKSEAMNLHDCKVTCKDKCKETKTVDRFISEAEGKLIASRYKPQKFLRVVSHTSLKSIQKISMTGLDKNNDVDENEELLDDTIENFDYLEQLGDDLNDYLACFTCEQEKN